MRLVALMLMCVAACSVAYAQTCPPQLAGIVEAADASPTHFAVDADGDLVVIHTLDESLGADQPGLVRIYRAGGSERLSLVGEITDVFTFDTVGFPSMNIARKVMLDLAGDTLYVAYPGLGTGSGQIVIRAIDLSDPANIPPRSMWEAWFVQLPLDFAFTDMLEGSRTGFPAFEVDGDDVYFYEYRGQYRLAAYDFNVPPIVGPADPAIQPTFLPEHSVTSVRVRQGGLVKSGHRVFVPETASMITPEGVDRALRIRVWDYTDPASPAIESETILPDFEGDGSTSVVGSTLVTGGYDFRVSPASNGVCVFSVADPLNPVFENFVTDAALPRLNEDEDLVSRSFAPCQPDLQLFDLDADPEPTLITGIEMPEPYDEFVQPLTRSADLMVYRLNRPDNAPDFAVVAFGCSGTLFEILELQQDLVIHPEDTTIGGVPLENARILVTAVIEPGCGGPPTITFIGDHVIESLSVEGGALVRVHGQLTADRVEARGGSLSVNGRLVTTDLDIIEGGDLFHEAESMMEIQP